jgi:hypothetical protein
MRAVLSEFPSRSGNMLQQVIISAAGASIIFLFVQSRSEELVRLTHRGVYEMPLTHRFGKRIPLPSTRQIRHELIRMWAADEIKKAAAATQLKSAWG